MRNATFIEDWIEESIQQGIQQGRREAIKGDIFQILQARFGLSYQLSKLEVHLEAIENLTMLQRLVVEAVQAESLDEFQSLLDELAPEESAKED